MATIEASTYRLRRDALLARHPDGPILVRGASRVGVNPNFLYLTGLDAPRGALLLSPAGVRIGLGAAHPGPDYQRGRIVHQLLFLPQPTPLAARWGEDAAATVDRITAEAALVDAVLSTDELDAVLGRALGEATLFHYVRGVPATLAGPDEVDAPFLLRVRERFFGTTLRDATQSVAELRRVKDAGELRAIERAIDVTREAIDRVLELARPGLSEHEIEGEITRIYRRHGATHAFDPIVATGLNAVFPHYHANAAPIEAGQLLLVDTGAVLDGYRGDVTRTLPVERRFNRRQRQVYDVVLEAQRAAIERCRPGELLAEVHATAFTVVARAGFGEYVIHGTSHHLGLETHDAGDVHRPLVAGAVITVEPGIYIPGESLGVRIEDDVLVAHDGPRVLSAGIPSAADEIERRMA